MLKTIYSTELVWGRHLVYNAIVLLKKIVNYGKTIEYQWNFIIGKLYESWFLVMMM